MQYGLRYPIWSRKRFYLWLLLGFVIAALFSNPSPTLRICGMVLNLAFVAFLPKWSHSDDHQFVNHVAVILLLAFLAIVGGALLVLFQHLGYEIDVPHALHHPALIWPLYITVMGVHYWRWNRAIRGLRTAF